jgi:hypothetical protein
MSLAARGRQLMAKKRGDMKKKGMMADMGSGSMGSGSPDRAGDPASDPDRTGGAGEGTPGIGRDGTLVFQTGNPGLTELYPCVFIDDILLQLRPAAEVCNGSCAQTEVGCCRAANGVICDEDNLYVLGAPVSTILQLSNVCVLVSMPQFCFYSHASSFG